MSGVTLWFDAEGRVAKVNFHGVAGALYSESAPSAGIDWIPSDRSLMFGLTAYANEAEFARALGTPVIQNEAGMWEVRRVWRKDGYLIDALFLDSPRTMAGAPGWNQLQDQDRVFPKGALVWFEVSRGL